MSEQQAVKAAKHVTVGCKHPNGLKLHLYTMETSHEPVMGGGSREVKVARRRPLNGIEEVVLNGFTIPMGVQKSVSGGYGLTFGVPADFMDEWMKQNAETPLVKNGLVFIASGRDAAESKAREGEKIKSNLEPLDPSTKEVAGRVVPADPRYPRPVGSNLSPIHTSDEQRG